MKEEPEAMSDSSEDVGVTFPECTTPNNKIKEEKEVEKGEEDGESEESDEDEWEEVEGEGACVCVSACAHTLEVGIVMILYHYFHELHHIILSLAHLGYRHFRKNAEQLHVSIQSEHH